MRLQTVFAAKVCTYVLFARGMYLLNTEHLYVQQHRQLYSIM